jgi:catechol 2,3-dioxygenase-like lactoylglutathione lyase family enzyme
MRRALFLLFALCSSVAWSLGSHPAEDVKLGISSRIHFNINVSNFERSRKFYEMLGFIDSISYPATNTLEVAQAMGINHTYLLRAELLFQKRFAGGFIDLIEWTNPRNLEPPYPALYHLGIVSAAVLSTNFDADVAYLQAQGAQFVSVPARWTDGSRFVMFKDPDGTFLELGEAELATGTSVEGPAIAGLGKISLNVSDLKRSHAFYQMLGFAGQAGEWQGGDPDIARALSVDSSYEFRKVLMHNAADGSALELTQWRNPVSNSPPFPAPINHLGIHRIAYSTNDLVGDIEKLKAQGVTFVSERAPCCEGPDSPHGIVVFEDPDGIFFELVDTDENYWEQIKAAYGSD